MLLVKCDICEEEIDDLCTLLTIKPAWALEEIEICDDCAGPVERFLDRNGLINVIDFDEDEDDGG